MKALKKVKPIKPPRTDKKVDQYMYSTFWHAKGPLGTIKKVENSSKKIPLELKKKLSIYDKDTKNDLAAHKTKVDALRAIKIQEKERLKQLNLTKMEANKLLDMLMDRMKFKGEKLSKEEKIFLRRKKRIWEFYKRFLKRQKLAENHLKHQFEKVEKPYKHQKSNHKENKKTKNVEAKRKKAIDLDKITESGYNNK